MPHVVRVACINQDRFLFQCVKTDVELKQFTRAVLREYESYLTRSGYKDDMPNPEVLYLVDSYGIAIQDQMMGPLFLSRGNLGCCENALSS
jgi:hypothetical protein